MRTILSAALVSLIAVGSIAPQSAFAGKKDKSAKEAPAEMMWMSEDKTHELDKAFVKAEEPMKRVVAAEEALATADTALTTLIDAVKAAGQNPVQAIQIKVDGGKPTLSAKDDFEGKANDVTAKYGAAIDAVKALESIAADCEAVTSSIQGADKSQFIKSPSEAMKVPKVISNNAKVVGALPGRAAALLKSVGELPVALKTKIGS